MNAALTRFVPLALVLTGISLLLFCVVQTLLRNTVNVPQIQMAEDAVRFLAHAQPTDVIPVKGSIPIDTSIGQFLAIYDGVTDPIVWNGSLHGEAARPPRGAFEAARLNQGQGTVEPYQHRITWEPEPGTRIALVLIYFPQKDMYVAAGRNLREIDRLIADIGWVILIGYLILMLVTLLATLMPEVPLRTWLRR